MSDYLSAERFIYGKLSGDATLTALIGGAIAPRIYNTTIPHEPDKETIYPAVVYQHQGGRDVQGLGATIIMVDELYLVKVVLKSRSYGDGETIWKRIQVLLHKTYGTVTDGRVLGCIRISPIKYATHEEGVEYRHLGATFRIFSQ